VASKTSSGPPPAAPRAPRWGQARSTVQTSPRSRTAGGRRRSGAVIGRALRTARAPARRAGGGRRSPGHLPRPGEGAGHRRPPARTPVAEGLGGPAEQRDRLPGGQVATVVAAARLAVAAQERAGQ